MKPRTQLITVISIAIIAIIVGGCSTESEPSETIIPKLRTDILLDSRTKAAAEDLSGFYTKFTKDAVDFVEKYDGMYPTKNVVVSPISMSILLSMVANGIDEDGQRQIADYIGVNDLEALNSLAKTLLNELPVVDNQTSLLFANSAWINNNLQLTESFSSLLEENYQSSIFYENFSETGIENKINNWCSDQTDGLVSEMVGHVEEGILAYLLNAMYFKGKWENSLKFNPKQSFKGIFFGNNDNTFVNMMKADEYAGKYYSNSVCEAFRMNFGNSAFNVTIILPNKSIDSNKLNSIISPELLRHVDSSYSSHLSITMPKFKIKNSLPMKEVLENAGLDITNRNIGLTMFKDHIETLLSVAQACSFEIDESGAEAAGVTMAEFGYIGTSIPEKINITVDRPFFFFINEVSTGACILSGRIADL